ncbi:MAG: hypothetical protein AB7V27_12835 [Candidatus Binatia bacterium]
MLSRWAFLACSAATLTAVGCASQQQQLGQKQNAAVQVALQRGRFDLNCPSATATVLSQDYIEPAVQGPWVSGLTRLEYTIGVQGCDSKATYVVMCQENTDTCFAAHPENVYEPPLRRALGARP